MTYDSPLNPVTATVGQVGSRSQSPRPSGSPGAGAPTPESAPSTNPRPAPPVAVIPKPALPEPRSLEELAEALRRVNLTFDLFEIQAKIEVQDGEFVVHITNSRTGEVIRRIPASQAPELAEALRKGPGVLRDLRV